MRVKVLDIVVRASGSTYLASAMGQRASCTASPDLAAARLGEKVFGMSLVRIERAEPMPADDHNVSRWELWGEPITAWCWQSGLIEIGRAMPEGALKIATGLHRDLERVLSVLARHGQGASDGKLLVPGVPETEDGDGKVDALTDWLQECAGRKVASIGFGSVKFNAKQRDRATPTLKQREGQAA